MIFFLGFLFYFLGACCHTVNSELGSWHRNAKGTEGG